ncbi:MAG: hypothetical protein JW986_01135 [Methanotrichaceae archaeon]|nr:hypothetical protein [Methanotrichaceae archaeon]
MMKIRWFLGPLLLFLLIAPLQASEIPEVYYRQIGDAPNNLSGLMWVVLPASNNLTFNANFDVSEAVAYYDWLLTGYGFDTAICASHGFMNGQDNLWLAVRLDEYVCYLESAEAGRGLFVLPEDSDYYKYSRPDVMWENIYEAEPENAAGSFDWWTAPFMSILYARNS